METERVSFHQKHFPHFIKWGKAIVWKWMHLYFPIVIHAMTDKYKDRWHHLVIDTIYVVITFVFVGANLGLGIWYLRYFTPADMNVQVLTTSDVTSGKRMDVSVAYVNGNRDLEDVTMDIFLPEGFLISKDDTEPGFVHYELGNLARLHNGAIDMTGVVVGDVGSSYDARVVTSYTSYGRRQYIASTKSFSIIDTSFHVSVDFPEAATYNYPTPWTIHYKNDSVIDMEDVYFDLNVPDEFSVQTVTVNGATANYQDGQPVRVGTVAAGTEGTVELTGIFRAPSDNTVIGDQEVAIDVLTHATILNHELSTRVPVSHGTSHASAMVIAPRVSATLTGDRVVAFGESIHATVTVTNTSEHPVDDIALYASTTSPATVTGAYTNGARGSVTDGVLALPVIEHLEGGEQQSITITLPTQTSDVQQVSSRLSVSGAGFSPDVQSPVPVSEVTLDTNYESRIAVTAALLYTGPNGEQIGYGPYPPQADEVTAMRVVLRLQNINNPLSGVRVHTTLPSQVEWTGLQSVSTGTTLHWDATTRSVDWTIPDLDPQSQVYGAQFEVRFHPNSAQVGLRPHVANDIIASAYDRFTGTSLTTSAGAVVSPAIVPN